MRCDPRRIANFLLLVAAHAIFNALNPLLCLVFWVFDARYWFVELWHWLADLWELSAREDNL